MDSLLDSKYYNFFPSSISFSLLINRKNISIAQFYIHAAIAFRLDLKNLQDLKEDKKKIKNDLRSEQSVFFDIQDAAPVKGKSIIFYGCLCITDLDAGKNNREM